MFLDIFGEVLPTKKILSCYDEMVKNDLPILTLPNYNSVFILKIIRWHI